MFWNKDKEKEKLIKRVSELENRIQELEIDLIHDPLTGLKTRTFFEGECSLYLSIIARSVESTRKELFGFKNLSILFFDIDHFKNINDVYGHQAGDSVLKQVAQCIATNMRAGDIVARWGGEEFVVSLLGATEKDAEKKGNEVRKKVAELAYELDPKLRLTTSVGVANSEKGISYEELLMRADEALYRAKESGRNRVVPYSALQSK